MYCLRIFPKKSSATVSGNAQNLRTSGNEFNDSRIPLTTRQKFVLIKNWKGIERDVSAAGVEMFLKMLTENPEYYKLFKFRSIANVEKEKQAQDQQLRDHGAAVMTFIGLAISKIEDADTFFSLLEENGKQHAHRKLFKPEMFWKMEQPFLHSVKSTLGERYTDNMDAIYKTVIQLILQRMEHACRMEMMKIQNKNIII